jgi:hypothetical protein
MGSVSVIFSDSQYMKQMEANITFTPILEQMAENCVLE